MIRSLVLFLLILIALAASSRGEVAESIRPVPFSAVAVDDPFWSPRLATNRSVTAAHVLDECERTGRIANFRIAAKALAERAPQPGGMRGLFFNDSDLYKAIEGCADLLATKRDPALEARCDEIIATIASAQEPDGYLYTSRTILDPRNMPPGGPARWSDMGGGHELYCVGHLFEAAVAYANTTGKRTLLEVATRNADLVATVFGPKGDQHPCGHPEVEIGLARLYEATGEARYLELLRFFIDTRGRADRGRGLYGEYAQDHAPVLEQRAAVGHAVRLAYLQSGILELARLTGDHRYLDASRQVWDDIVRHKMYLTGGIGSQGNNEGFGIPYELANGSAYNETCASIAFVQWSHRLFLATGHARYVDVLERTLHNGMLAGWSLSGNRFFYPNPLESASGRERAPWFDCACCPPNVLRFIASMPQFAYATGQRDLYVNLFLGGTATAKVGDVEVGIEQRGTMPFEGQTTITLRPTRETSFALRVRVPAWARGGVADSDLYRVVSDGRSTSTAPPIEISVNGTPVVASNEHGYAVIDRAWKSGDTVAVRLAMPVLTIEAHEKVAADRGRIALSRGPFVYCVEAVDLAGRTPLGAVVDMESPWTVGPVQTALGGVPTLRGAMRPVERAVDGGVRTSDRFDATAIPYALWANRGSSAMAVWLARDPSAAKPAPAPTLARKAKTSSSFGGDLAAISDQLEPASSGDHEHPFLHWWPRMGTEETITYDFAAPTAVRAVEVYWFDDTGRGACRLPRSWRLDAKRNGAWTPVESPSGFGVVGDRYNRCEFRPVTAEGLRITVTSQPNWAGGIHEWRVEAAPASNATDARPQPQALLNGGFEEGDAAAHQAWSRSMWGAARGGEDVGFLSEASGRNGRAVGIRSGSGADAAWSQTVPIEPWSRYKLSAWIRTEDVQPIGNAKGALLNLHGTDVRTDSVTGTKGWTEVAVEFESEEHDAVMINCLFGGWGLATGTAWFDDLRLELLHKGDVPAPHIAIDASRIGEPISPYIYGQFIEHLGRCIYGGIWAEMLEDRKFFMSVGHDDSPWRAVSAATISMDTSAAFVGAHSPVMKATAKGGGLAQANLASMRGRRYVGRLWIAGDASVAPVTVQFGDSDPVVIPSVAPTWTRHELAFTATSDDANASFSVTVGGAGTLRVGTASLMPADNVQGFRADTMALLRELDSPVYRWPGGNFVSGYDWRDGIGDPDRRAPRKNPAWTGIEHNDVGIHEFLDFCALLKSEPYIAVNTGLGGVESAAQEVEYVNGAVSTSMGKLRATHGRSEPWKVKFWGIGNEMYGSWQLGNVPLSEYTKRHNAFVDAMRAVDPSIHAIAVGAAGEWSSTMLRDCADRMESMSEHVYWQERPGLLAHVRQAPDSLRHIAQAHRRYRKELPSLKGRDIRIVQDEWNYWYGPHVFGELGTRYFMRDALGCAAALHEFGRNSDLFFMANYAQTVNVIGAIKTSKTNAALESTGLVLALYRRELGTLPCQTTTSPSLDALATWNAERTELRIAIVNASRDPASVRLELTGATLAGTGRRWEIAHPDPLAFNDPDGARSVSIRESSVDAIGDALPVAACSVTLYALGAVPASR
jgi:uncharacterized protein